MPSVSKPERQPADRRDQHRAQRDRASHRAEPLGWADPEQRLMDKLRRPRSSARPRCRRAQPMKAARTTSQISSARTSARRTCGACSTAEPSGRRGRRVCGRLWSGSHQRRTQVLPAGGRCAEPARVELPGEWRHQRRPAERRRGDECLLGPDPAPRNQFICRFGMPCGKNICWRPKIARIQSRLGSASPPGRPATNARTTSTTGSCGGEAQRAGVQRLEGRRPGAETMAAMVWSSTRLTGRDAPGATASSACSRCATVVLMPGRVDAAIEPHVRGVHRRRMQQPVDRAARAANPDGEIVRQPAVPYPGPAAARGRWRRRRSWRPCSAGPAGR